LPALFPVEAKPDDKLIEIGYYRRLLREIAGHLKIQKVFLILLANSNTVLTLSTQ